MWRRCTDSWCCCPQQDEVDVVKMRLAEVLTSMSEDTSVILVGFMQLFRMNGANEKHTFKSAFYQIRKS